MVARRNVYEVMFSGDVDIELMSGPQKNLIICCTPTVEWDGFCTTANVSDSISKQFDPKQLVRFHKGYNHHPPPPSSLPDQTGTSMRGQACRSSPVLQPVCCRDNNTICPCDNHSSAKTNRSKNKTDAKSNKPQDRSDTLWITFACSRGGVGPFNPNSKLTLSR